MFNLDEIKHMRKSNKQRLNLLMGGDLNEILSKVIFKLTRETTKNFMLLMIIYQFKKNRSYIKKKSNSAKHFSN